MMSLKCLRQLFLALVLYPSVSMAHPFVSWEMGVSYRQDLSSGVLASWGDTWGMFVGAGRSLLPGLEVSPRLAYRRGAFDTFRGFSPIYYIPEIRYSAYSGKALQAYESSVALRLVGGEPAKAFMSFRGGVLILDVGDVNRERWHQDHPEDRCVVKAPDTGETVTKLFYGAGPGFLFGVNASVSMGVEAEAGFSADGEIRWLQVGSFIRFR